MYIKEERKRKKNAKKKKKINKNAERKRKKKKGYKNQVKQFLVNAQSLRVPKSKHF